MMVIYKATLFVDNPFERIWLPKIGFLKDLPDVLSSYVVPYYFGLVTTFHVALDRWNPFNA